MATIITTQINENMEKALDLTSLGTVHVRHDTMSLFPILTDAESSPDKITKLYPSTFLRELQLTTEERLDKLRNSSSLHQPSRFFIVTPSVILFQSCHPGKIYSVPFSVRNCSQILRLLSVQYETSPYFSISYLNKVSSKVAPGMSVQFVLKFIPAEYKDYSYTVTFNTRGEVFSIPVIALGPRPLLDFPDKICMEEAIVKIPHSKVIVVHNIGLIPVTFNVITEYPFSVTPEKNVLNIGQTALVKLTLHTSKAGNGSSKLWVKYETGEELEIDLIYSAKSVNIELDSKSVYFSDTFMGLQCLRSTTLHNKSNNIVNYFWHKFPDLRYDVYEMERMKDGLRSIQYWETYHCGELEYSGAITKDENERMYSRIYSDEVAGLNSKDFLYVNSNFSITPSSGELWPNCSVTFAVVFSPSKDGGFTSTAFCEVEGKEERIPLRMEGVGLGPDIQLSLDYLDMNNIFLCSLCSFEVLVKNEGSIPGNICFMDTDKMFGGKVTCTPKRHCLQPQEFSTFIFTFSSNRVGLFVEDICFKIEESSKQVKLLFKGTVINPILCFSKQAINFGTIPVGCQVMKSVQLINQSSVPVTFSLHVPNDGGEEAISMELFASSIIKPALAISPKQFTIKPSAGVLEAHSTVDVQITLIANAEHKYTTHLVAENKVNPTEPVILQMSYKSVIANLICEPNFMNIHFCFINFPTNNTIKISNTSQVTGFFVIPDLPPKMKEVCAVTTSINEGYINPQETKEIIVSVNALVKGTHNVDLKMLVFGMSHLTTICAISCTGQGPVVSYKEKSLAFGKVTLLEQKSLSITFLNGSPIPAEFTAGIEYKRKAKWELEPMSGVIQPEKSVVLTVMLTLVDPGNFTASLLMNVKHSRVIKIDMFASGTGSSIVFEPNIFPELNLGFLFSCRLYQFPLKISNPGTRQHLIQFMPDRFSIRSINANDLSYFRFKPPKFDLEGGGETEIFLEAHCVSLQEMVEQFNCWANAEKKSLRETLGNCIVRAQFISPALEVSDWKIEFDISVGPKDLQGQIKSREITIKNTSQLPVTVNLKTEPPFYLVGNEDQKFYAMRELSINSHTEVSCVVVFKPEVQRDLYSIVYNSSVNMTYLEHPQVDKIQLIGHLNFPNIHLSERNIDFSCIPIASEACKDVRICNTSPLPVSFHWMWDENSIVINKIEEEYLEKRNSLMLMGKRSLRSEVIWSLPEVPFTFNENKVLRVALDDIKNTDHQAKTSEIENISEAVIRDKVFPIISTYSNVQPLLPELNILPKQSVPNNIISKFIDITPMRGCIQPYQSQVLSIAFRPDPFLSISATALCCIDGGPMEALYFSGQSSSYNILVSNIKIDFGFRLFSSVCEEIVTISNFGLLECEFNTEICSRDTNQVDKLVITPDCGKISSLSSTTLAIKYYPGNVGEFHEKAILQIGYLKPIELTVNGFGLFPQVFVSLPETPRPNYPIHYMYSAIASLTADRFHKMMLSIHDESCSSFDEFEFLDDWCSIDRKDDYPIDSYISLAIERVMLYHLVKSNPQILDQMPLKRNKPIPNFVVPGYFMDFGSIVIGTVFDYSMTIENRGLLRADVTLHVIGSEKKLKKDGIFVEYHNTYNLPLCRSIPLRIIFRPTLKRYPKEESIDIHLQLQVNKGATIPINMKALFTFPNLIVNCTEVNFGKVACGFCKILCISLKNESPVPCEWSVSLRVIKRKKLSDFTRTSDYNPFSVNISSGVYPPKTAGVLAISFTPKFDKINEVLLNLEMKHNPESLTILLQGIGVEPKVIISEKYFDFGAALPNSKPIVKTFSIMNPCHFEVEVYFRDYDALIFQEDRILRVLTHIYNTGTILLPVNLYSTKVQSELQGFYNKLVDEVRTSLINATISETKSSASNDRNISSTSRSKKLGIYSSSIPSEQLIEDPFQLLTKESQIEELIHEYIEDTYKRTSIESERLDPLHLLERTAPKPALKSEVNKEGVKRGILFIFHGALHTEYVFWANRTAKKLFLSVLNIDQIILEESATSINLCALKVRETIKTAFIEKFLGTEILPTLAEGEDLEMNLEQLTKIINLLVTHKGIDLPKIIESSPSSRPGTKSRKSSKSGTKSGTKSVKSGKHTVPVEDTFSSIPIETITELIGPRVLAEATSIGVVIESLTGTFIPNAVLALNMLLEIVRNIGHIQFVSISNSFEEYQTRENLLKEEKEKKLNEIQQKRLSDLMNLTSDELDQLNQEDLLLISRKIIPLRKQLLQEKYYKLETKKHLISSNKAEQKHKDENKNKTADSKKKVMKDELLMKSGSTSGGKSKSKEKVSTAKTSKSRPDTAKSEKLPKGAKKKKLSAVPDEEFLKAQDLLEKFTRYRTELSQIVPILQKWNRITCEPVNVASPVIPRKLKTPGSQKQPKSKSPNTRTSVIPVVINKDKTKPDPAVGVPFWLVVSPEDPNLEWFDGLINTWLRLRNLNKARVKEVKWDDLPDYKRVLLACVNKPEERKQNLCRPTINFHIYSSASKIESFKVTSKQMLEKRSITSSKNSSSLTTEEVPTKNSNSLTTEEVPTNYDFNRIILRPGESITRTAVFIPHQIGEFKQKIVLEIAGWRNNYTITCEACCDIPRIETNPSFMFCQVADELDTVKISHCVYLLHEEIFYFGPVLASKCENKRTHDRVTYFNFSNISRIPAEITFHFTSNQDSNLVEAFGFTPEVLIIEPGECKQLEVYACPTSFGKEEETLVYHIKHNDTPGYIKLSCIGIKPELSFEPKLISFNRVLLYRKEVRTLQLKNKCYEPLGWKLVGYEQLLNQQISISELSGIVSPMATYDVYFHFTAEKVEFFKSTITIEVYDDQFRGDPFFSDPLPISAECVDVLVDVIFPTQKCTYLNFDQVKVGEKEIQRFVLKNKGKYDVTFQIKYHENSDDLAFDPQEVFFINPKYGTLKNTGKSTVIEVSCFCKLAINITNVPIFQVWIIDTGPKLSPVAKIPISVTIRSFTSKFRITPCSDINFGPMIPGSTKTQSLIIENIGTFAFTFKIISREQAEIEDKAVLQQSSNPATISKSAATIKTNKTKTLSRLSSRGKSAKGKATLPTKLVVGVFTLSQCFGDLEPSESLTINIDCFIQTAGTYKEEIVIRVTECATKDMKGQTITINSSGFFPKLDFGNTDFIFQDAILETHIEKITGEPIVVYNQETHTLKFQNMCVGTEEALSIGLHLHNCEQVSCPVIVTLDEIDSAFKVTPKLFTISSLCTETVNVSFTPHKMGLFEDQMIITIDMPTSMGQNITFLTRLIGEASFPQIEVIKPTQFITPCNKPELAIHFPPTEVGFNSEKQFAIQNVSTISCRVLIQVMENKKRIFSITPTKDTIPAIHLWNPNDKHQSLTITKIKPDEICEFIVKFSPTKAHYESCKIKIFIANNPYEDKIVNVLGLGHEMHFIINDLPCTMTENENAGRTPIQHLLDFETCIVGNTQEKFFCVSNRSKNSVYRFEFEKHDNISFEPQLGHLTANSRKNIKAIFTSNPPQTVIDKEIIKCKISQLADESEPPLSDWDDTQVSVHWVEVEESGVIKMEKVLNGEEEPLCTVIPGTEYSLPLLVSAQAHCPKITCPNPNIEFLPTFVYNEERQEIILVNSGLTKVRYKWEMHKEKTYAVKDSVIISQCSGVSMSEIKPTLVPITSLRKQLRYPSSVTSEQYVISSPLLNTKYHNKPHPIPKSANLLTADYYSTTSAHFDVLTCINLDEQIWPIFFTPKSGEILSNSSVTTTVSFLPMILRTYECCLELKIDSYDAEYEPIEVNITGSSLMPCVHLAVEPDPKFIRTSNSQNMTIEFRGIGIGVVYSKSVCMMNPTAAGFNFQWVEIQSPSKKAISPFSCSDLFGYIDPRIEKTVIFSFVPDTATTFESLWMLLIPERDIRQIITVRGTAEEPSVSLQSTYLNLDPVLIGLETSKEISIYNNEDINLKFNVVEDSLYSETRSENLSISPMVGEIEANGELRLRVTYIPKTSGEIQFRVCIRIDRRYNPLLLDVKSTCYPMQPLLCYERFDKCKTNMTSLNPNEIDVGTIALRIPENLTFHLTNFGKSAFYFNWVLDSEQIENSFDVSIVCRELSGLVTSQSRSVLIVRVTPLKRTTFKNIELKLQISKGPTYVILLSGTASAPTFEFSFIEFNFGMCFVQTSSEVFHKKILHFRNLDEHPMLLEVQFKNTNYMSIQLQDDVVAPRAEMEISIIFQARACQKYNELIPFVVNGSYTSYITIKGEGILMQVTLVNPADKLIDLGSVLVGGFMRHNILIANKSKKTVNAKFTIVAPAISDIPQRCPFTLKPKNIIPIIPSQTATLNLKFAPKRLIHNFVGQIMMQCESTTESLCIVKCSSVGADISLDRDLVAFGNVVVGNECVSRFLLLNNGDVLIKFKWILEESEVFTITPKEGFSTPGTNIIHEVKFSPNKLNPEYRIVAVCALEGYNDLSLTLTGRSIELPPPIEIIYMSCQVRKNTVKTIYCKPNLGQKLLILPAVNGDYFSGPETLSMELYSPLEYSLTYSPLVMTPENIYHEGSVVFPFPDGSCLHYAIRGTAEPPSAEDTISVNIVTHFVSRTNLPICNWLNVNQRFLVSYEALDQTNKESLNNMAGNYFIDVAPHQTRDYSLTFHTHLPGSLLFKVVFTNELTHEFLWFKLEYQVKQCHSLKKIILNTRVREPVTYVLSFRNVFAEVLHFEFYSPVKEVTALNLPCDIQPGEEKGIILQYLPLHPTSSSKHYIELRGGECGVFPYTVIVAATPPSPEPAVSLTCEIGQQKQIFLSLKNMSVDIAKFMPINSHPDFIVKGPIIAPPGVAFTVEVIYEPSSFHNVYFNLEVGSEEAGSFVIPLIGTCIKPKPIGPIVIEKESSVTITLTNVFDETKTFCWYIDPPEFVLDTFTATVEPKKVLEILVKMPLTEKIQMIDPQWEHLPITGKLVVTISDPTLSHIKWSFYIKAKLND